MNSEVSESNPFRNVFTTISYDEYIKRFDQLWLLSKQGFIEDALDEEAEKWGKKFRRQSIDEHLINDFIRIRNILASDIQKRNVQRNLNESQIDEAIQRILDRFIFIRTCEDREYENNVLISSVNNWADNWRKGVKLLDLIRLAYTDFDDKYNSKLFQHHLCDELEISPEVLKEVIDSLYVPKDKLIKYDFSLIHPDILGRIYEQYLSIILRKKQKGVNFLDDSAHKKEQGIYYTPTHIVEFITKNTIGRYLKDKESGKLRILDPACGSGSFLIKSYDILHEYAFGISNNVSVNYDKKLDLVKDSIFGVDLDPKATEIAQLNILLKIAEKKHKLPMLKTNIQNGNSLVEDENLAGSDAFVWKKRFKEIMDEGGFNVIVGNPPYFNIKAEDDLKSLDDYKILSNGVVNIAAIFVKRSVDLLKSNGYLGFIIPKSFAYVDSWKPLREFLYKNTQFIVVVDVSKGFKDVLLEQVIIIVKKQKPDSTKFVSIISGFNTRDQAESKILYSDMITNNVINLSSGTYETSISDKMKKGSVLLGKISENFRGIGAQKFVKERGKERILSGKDIQRYCVRDYNNYYISEKDISEFKKSENLKRPKIVVQNIVAHIKNHIKITATYDEDNTLNLDTVNNIIIKDEKFLPKYILALLNSKLISYYTYNFIYSKAIRTMHFDSNYSGKIPIKIIPIEKQKEFSKLSEKLITLNSKIVKFGSDEKTLEEIERIEKELNNKIYELYGLTKNEILSVEKTFG